MWKGVLGNGAAERDSVAGLEDSVRLRMWFWGGHGRGCGGSAGKVQLTAPYRQRR